MELVTRSEHNVGTDIDSDPEINGDMNCHGLPRYLPWPHSHRPLGLNWLGHAALASTGQYNQSQTSSKYASIPAKWPGLTHTSLTMGCSLASRHSFLLVCAATLLLQQSWTLSCTVLGWTGIQCSIIALGKSICFPRPKQISQYVPNAYRCLINILCWCPTIALPGGYWDRTLQCGAGTPFTWPGE